jgi:Siphovirus-type tail component, C-terminal domain
MSVPLPVDLGFWTGSLVYEAPYGTVTVPFGNFDSNGIAWILHKVEGWDSPDTAGQLIQRSADHGGWAASQYFAPRIITLTVTASAATQALRDVARATFQQACPVSDFATFTLNEPLPKLASVRRSGRVIETYPTLTDVQFNAVFAAPDPRKYDLSPEIASAQGQSTLTGAAVPLVIPVVFPAQPPAGSLTATNSGNFETRPMVTIRGPISDPGVTNVTYGQSVTFTGTALATGDVLTLDMDNRQTFLNGQVRYIADHQSSWWVLQPGDNTIQFSGDTTGGAQLTVSWLNAYI